MNYLLEGGEPVGPVTAAMDALDRDLSREPLTVGESRPNYERVHTIAPLTVWYAVHEDDRIVYVL